MHKRLTTTETDAEGGGGSREREDPVIAPILARQDLLSLNSALLEFGLSGLRDRATVPIRFGIGGLTGPSVCTEGPLFTGHGVMFDPKEVLGPYGRAYEPTGHLKVINAHFSRLLLLFYSRYRS